MLGSSCTDHPKVNLMAGYGGMDQSHLTPELLGGSERPRSGGPRQIKSPARKGRVGGHAKMIMWVRPPGGRGRVEGDA